MEKNVMGKRYYKKIKAVLKPPQWLRHPPPHKRISGIIVNQAKIVKLFYIFYEFQGRKALDI